MEVWYLNLKFNETICEEIIKYPGDGLTITSCANLVEIDRTTIHSWINKGKDSNDEEDHYRKFYLGMEKARAKYIMYHKRKIAESTDWRAHKYLLEVLGPDTYLLERRIRMKYDENLKVKMNKKDFYINMLY